jgi:hypothetical protein
MRPYPHLVVTSTSPEIRLMFRYSHAARLPSVFSFVVVAALAPSLRAQPGPEGPPPNGAAFQSMPMPPPNMNVGNYAPQSAPNSYVGAGGYLAGAANVISSQGQFMQDQQQAYLTQQQVKQQQIVTRRDKVNEYMYERKTLPTQLDDQIQFENQQLRWSRDNPPLTTIWSGRALNDLLTGIQQQLAQGIPRPDVPLASDVVNHLNVTGGQSTGSMAVIANDGTLRWPLALAGPTFQTDETTLQGLCRKIYQQVVGGNVDPTTFQNLTTAVNTLQTDLTQNVANMDPNAFIAGQRFVNELNQALNVLQSPSAANYFNGTYAARGHTVKQLAQDMISNGLRFAPALPVDQPAYTAAQRAMSDYYLGPQAKDPWDPLAR